VPNSNHGKERIVIKFGGASLADSERISKGTESVVNEVKRGSEVIVVVSAMGKTTDTLINLLEDICGKSCEKIDIDDVLSMGERTSTRIFSTILKSKGLKVKYFDPSDEDWPIITNEDFFNANPIDKICGKRIVRFIEPLLCKGIVPVIPGFIGKTREGKISTIGRGGSDTTAFMLANSLKAKEVVMVTDSDGIMTADPKILPTAKRIPKIDMDFLVKLADSNTKFLHMKALRYKAPETDIRVIDFSKGDLSAEGTIITGGIESELEVELMKDSSVASITVVGKKISEKSSIIHELVEKVRGHAKLIGLSLNFDSAILYVSENRDLKKLLENLHLTVRQYEATIALTVREKLGFLKIKGVGLEETPGVIGKTSESLRLNGINIFGILTITSSILIFVEWNEAKRAKGIIEKALED